ncbi:MAG: type II secretion system protein GspG [Planctomycetales bacterium]|nr:type II secretion system protein GspG [Planctomycetales bacterium]
MSFRLGRKKWLVLVIVVAVAAVAAKLAILVKFGPPVTISKETTYITEPLHPDGFPDYVGALNQRFSEGVTPENNSSVLFWKAVGPGEIDKEKREQYFRMLGIPPLPEKGDYFVTFDEHVKAHIDHQMDQAQPADNLSEEKIRQRYWKQLDSAMKRPWSKQEFPVWAEWIAANEKPLALLIEASKRPRRYDPLIGKDVISLELWGPQCSRDVARALVARAMLRLNDGKPDEAWGDLMACHRLARLVAQGPTVIEALVAVTIEGIACNGDQALLERGKLAPARIAEMREELAKLPPMPVMADKIDVAERFMCLDAITTMARKGPDAINKDDNETPEEDDEPTGALASLEKSMRIASFDWDLMLRMQNEWYDRVVEACRKPTQAERNKAIQQIDEDINEIKRTRNWKTMLLSFLTNSRQARSRLIGQIYLSLLLPSSSAVIAAEDRVTMRFELIELAFALAAYHADHGAYPAKLDELVPKYVKAVPKDIFNNDADLQYTRQDNGYLLYSFGPNGKDDGGKGPDDRINNADWHGEDWDDLIVRIPSKPEG